MQRELKIAIKKVRSELKKTTDKTRISELRDELSKLKSLIQKENKEKLAS